MTGPESVRARWPRRRVWWVGAVAAWIVVVAALGIWSVPRDRATVPDQRDIVAAVADLQRAVGALFVAADGDSRAVVLGALEVARNCQITPVREGFTARRDVTVHVRQGEAKAALDAIADGLPESYRAEVAVGRHRLVLHADAGNFVGIDGDAAAGDGQLIVEVSTGCRPPGSAEPDEGDPAAGAAPAVLGTVLAKLGGSGEPVVQAVACPDGGVAATWSVNGVATPAGVAGRLRELAAGGRPVRGDESAWAYRAGGDAVVVIPDEKQLQVSVSKGC